MEIRHADLQIEVEDAEDGGVLLTIIDSARLSLTPPARPGLRSDGPGASARGARPTANIMRGTPEGCSSGRVRASGAVARSMGRSAAVRPPAGL
jgi:hypothetical protein